MPKQKKSLKYDFSSTNWGEAMQWWLKGVKKWSNSLFPEVSKHARILASIKVKVVIDIGSSSSGSDADSSRCDLDSDFEGIGNSIRLGQGGSAGDDDVGRQHNNRSDIYVSEGKGGDAPEEQVDYKIPDSEGRSGSDQGDASEPDLVPDEIKSSALSNGESGGREEWI